ncbi:MAG: hypothetical protein QE484_03870 [Rhizobium sp.]|nr:hypothetical protein [Rhizobium sp.]
MILLLSLGADMPPETTDTAICGCRAPLESAAVLRDVTGKVFVSQPDGMQPARTDADFSLPARLLTGPKSQTTIQIGDTCTLSVPEKQLVRIDDDRGAWCVQADAAGPGLPSQASASVQSPLPISILGALAGTSVLISAATKDERVSR